MDDDIVIISTTKPNNRRGSSYIQKATSNSNNSDIIITSISSPTPIQSNLIKCESDINIPTITSLTKVSNLIKPKTKKKVPTSTSPTKASNLIKPKDNIDTLKNDIPTNENNVVGVANVTGKIAEGIKKHVSGPENDEGKQVLLKDDLIKTDNATNREIKTKKPRIVNKKNSPTKVIKEVSSINEETPMEIKNIVEKTENLEVTERHRPVDIEKASEKQVVSKLIETDNKSEIIKTTSNKQGDLKVQSGEKLHDITKTLDEQKETGIPEILEKTGSEVNENKLDKQENTNAAGEEKLSNKKKQKLAQEEHKLSDMCNFTNIKETTADQKKPNVLDRIIALKQGASAPVNKFNSECLSCKDRDLLDAETFSLEDEDLLDSENFSCKDGALSDFESLSCDLEGVLDSESLSCEGGGLLDVDGKDPIYKEEGMEKQEDKQDLIMPIDEMVLNKEKASEAIKETVNEFLEEGNTVPFATECKDKCEPDNVKLPDSILSTNTNVKEATPCIKIILKNRLKTTTFQISETENFKSIFDSVILGDKKIFFKGAIISKFSTPKTLQLSINEDHVFIVKNPLFDNNKITLKIHISPIKTIEGVFADNFTTKEILNFISSEGVAGKTKLLFNGKILRDTDFGELDDGYCIDAI
ncbi:hypothetical protein CDIK_0625 [Cucumispora dikerogammari]|nr:hypothetical protein CDIK_0625 [Cucumispora dikerogammari]